MFSENPSKEKVLSRDFKNRQIIADQNCSWQQFPNRRCWKSESTPGKVCVGERLDQQMNIKFGCRHVQWFGRAGKPEWKCSVLGSPRLALIVTLSQGLLVWSWFSYVCEINGLDILTLRLWPECCYCGRCVLVICVLLSPVNMQCACLCDGAPCGLRGCKNGPAPFPGRMSYKATKPGLVSVLYLSMFFIVLVVIRAPFYVLLVFIVCVLSFGCSS